MHYCLGCDDNLNIGQRYVYNFTGAVIPCFNCKTPLDTSKLTACLCIYEGHCIENGILVDKLGLVDLFYCSCGAKIVAINVKCNGENEMTFKIINKEPIEKTK